MSHPLRHFASHQQVVIGGVVSVALCEMCGTVYLIQPNQMRDISGMLSVRDASSIDPEETEFESEPITQELVIELFTSGIWVELDKALCEGGVVIREYRRIHDAG